MKKIMVRAVDYEIYKIFLPWKCLFARTQNRFILTELERQHPRFSANCCYDAKYLLQKKNLLAEVVVMEKSSLARYKNCGGILFLENEKKRIVFSGRAKIVRFVSILILLVMGIFSFRIARSIFFDGAAKPGVVIAENQAETQSQANAALIEDDNPSLGAKNELLKEVFASVSKRGGKLSSFSFRKKVLSRGGKISGECKFSVYGCDCEEVANARYCVVSFKDNVPHFEVILPFFENTEQAGILSEIPVDVAAEFPLPSLRNSLRSLGAYIESERNGAENAEIVFSADSSFLYSCLKTCAKVLDDSSWGEESLSLTENAGKCRVSLSVSRRIHSDPESEGILQTCAQYAYLFSSKIKIMPKKAKLFQLPQSDYSKAIVVKEKIGEVRRKDGEVFVCYRNIDGRTTFEKKETVND